MKILSPAVFLLTITGEVSFQTVSAQGATTLLSGKGLTFSAQVPSGWIRRDAPAGTVGALLFTKQTPPEASMVLISGAESGPNNVSEQWAGFEEGASGGGQAVLKKLSARDRTLGGVAGQERQYQMTIKANNAKLRLSAWLGADGKHFYSFQLVTPAALYPKYGPAFDKVLSSFKVKPAK